MEINLFGGVGYEITAEDISYYLSHATDDITLKINSYGGDIAEAHAIYNLLREYQGKVNCEIIGVCASAATSIAMSADNIKMKTNSLFMIHEVSIQLSDLIKASDLAKIVDGLQHMNETLIDVYQAKTKLDRTEIANLLKNETWMNATEAKSKGFIDEIIPIDPPMNRELEIMNAMRDKILSEERARVAELNQFKSSNQATQAVINVAISDGKTLSEIKPYLDAIGKTEESCSNELKKQFADYLESGANTVNSAPVISDDAQKKAARDEVIALQRKMRGE